MSRFRLSPAGQVAYRRRAPQPPRSPLRRPARPASPMHRAALALELVTRSRKKRAVVSAIHYLVADIISNLRSGRRRRVEFRRAERPRCNVVVLRSAEYLARMLIVALRLYEQLNFSRRP